MLINLNENNPDIVQVLSLKELVNYLILNKRYSYRIVFDANKDLYAIGPAYRTIHEELVNSLVFSYNLDYKQSAQYIMNTKFIYLLFTPKTENIDIGFDNNNKAYIFKNFGTIYTKGDDILQDLYTDISNRFELIEIKHANQKLAEHLNNLNANFWNWFGDSITVDDKGNPIIFYHGTRSDFVEFKSEYDDNLIFFAFDKKFADEWGRNKSYSNDIKDTIYNKAKPYRNSLYKSYQSRYGDDFYYNDEEAYKLYKDEINDYENKLEKEYNVHSRTIPCYLKIHKIFMPEKHYELVLNEIINYYGFPKEAPDHRREIEELRKEKEILISNFKSSGRKLPTKEEEDALNTINDKISILYDEQNSIKDFETNHLPRIKKGAWIYFEHGIVIDKIWSLGFDAIQLSESNGQQTTMAVRANNNQIKAINNNGNWSNSNNIYEDIHHFNINDINFDDIDLDWDDLGIDDKEDENKLEIEYDPTEHWVVVDKNSINDNFAKWWGNSQCCNSKGEPIIVYHSTNTEFDTFKTNLDGTANGRPVYGGGFCFSAYENYTKEFGRNTMPCVLSIQKPLDLSKNPKLNLLTTYKLMYKDNWRKYYYDIDHVSRGYLQDKSENVISCFQLLNNEGYSFEEIMNAYGYDGIIDGHVFVVVRPNQIKSINNRGTWLKDSDNIYEQIAYHGTNANFTKFDLDKFERGDYGYGIYLTQDKLYASDYGTIKQCNIPDDMFLLDWESSLNYQSEYIQDKLYNIWKQTRSEDMDSKIEKAIFGNQFGNTGYWIYMMISEVLGLSPKDTSSYLYNQGIKGITSWAGNCIVIFNPEEIEIREAQMDLNRLKNLNESIDKILNEDIAIYTTTAKGIIDVEFPNHLVVKDVPATFYTNSKEYGYKYDRNIYGVEDQYAVGGYVGGTEEYEESFDIDSVDEIDFDSAIKVFSEEIREELKSFIKSNNYLIKNIRVDEKSIVRDFQEFEPEEPDYD